MLSSIELLATESALRCPYCHDTLAAAASVACGRCQSRHHLACFVENGGCSIAGCRPGTAHRVVGVAARPGTEPSARRRLALGFLAALPTLVAFIAGSLMLVGARPPQPPPGIALPSPDVPLTLPQLTSPSVQNETFAMHTLAQFLRGDSLAVAVLQSGSSHGYRFRVFHEKSGDEWTVCAEPLEPGVTGDLVFEAHENENTIDLRRR